MVLLKSDFGWKVYFDFMLRVIGNYIVIFFYNINIWFVLCFIVEKVCDEICGFYKYR